MGGKLGEEFCRHGFSIEPLLKHAEGLRLAVSHDQQFAVDGKRRDRNAREFADEIGKGAGDILARARKEPDDLAAFGVGPDARLDADAIPFPFRPKVFDRQARSSSASSSAWASMAERKGAGSRLSGFSALPSSQAKSSR